MFTLLVIIFPKALKFMSATRLIKNLFTSRASAVISKNCPFKNETSVLQPITGWKTKFFIKTIFKKYSAVTYLVWPFQCVSVSGPSWIRK